MRIAIVSNTVWNLANFRLNLMLALRAEGHTVVAIAPSGEFQKKLIDAGFQFHPVNISGRGTNPILEGMSVWSLLRAFRQHKIDTVLAFTPKGNLYSGLACLPLRIRFAPNISGLGSTTIRRSFASSIVMLLYAITLRRAHHVFFQNRDDFDLFVRRRLVSKSISEVIPGSGVDLFHFAPQTSINRLESSFNRCVFILVARMIWDKGVAEYVQACRLIRKTHPEVRFQLLGPLDVDNPTAVGREQMQSWVSEGLIEYLGDTTDVRPFLANADCVVLPSYREGVPRTLLEAAAMGLPIITTDVPGCREVVVDKLTGMLCRPRDSKDIATRMHEFLRMTQVERSKMGASGRRKIELEFDERIVIGKYLKFLASSD